MDPDSWQTDFWQLFFDDLFPWDYPIWRSLLILSAFNFFAFRLSLFCSARGAWLGIVVQVLLVLLLLPTHHYRYSFCGVSGGGTSIWMPLFVVVLFAEELFIKKYILYGLAWIIVSVLVVVSSMKLRSHPWVFAIVASASMCGGSLLVDPEPESLAYELDIAQTYLKTGVACAAQSYCCFAEAALESRNPNICLRMWQKSLISECLIVHAGSTSSNNTDCEIFDSVWRQVEDFGKFGNELRTQHASLRDLCLRALALERKDISLCREIQNSESQLQCMNRDVPRYEKFLSQGPNRRFFCDLPSTVYFPGEYPEAK